MALGRCYRKERLCRRNIGGPTNEDCSIGQDLHGIETHNVPTRSKIFRFINGIHFIT